MSSARVVRCWVKSRNERNPCCQLPARKGGDSQGIYSCVLPTLSSLSVRWGPVGRLRHWCSSRSLRISPLHREFRYPLHHSSPAVSKAGPALKTGVSLQTYKTTYAPFTPSHSGQRLLPTYYRGCWHVVSRSFLAGYRLLLVPCNRGLRSENLLPSRGVAGSGLRPLPNIPHCCLP